MEQRNIDIGEAIRRWTEGHFCYRSGFYAGRGPQRSDLNSRILEMIYQGLKEELGEGWAQNFVRFVNNLNDLSASSFIVAFDQFWASNGTELHVQQRPEDRSRLSGRGGQLEAEAFGAIASALGRGSRTPEKIEADSARLKQEFIVNHRDEIPEQERRNDGPSYVK